MSNTNPPTARNCPDHAMRTCFAVTWFYIGPPTGPDVFFFCESETNWKDFADIRTATTPVSDCPSPPKKSSRANALYRLKRSAPFQNTSAAFMPAQSDATSHNASALKRCAAREHHPCCFPVHVVVPRSNDSSSVRLPTLNMCAAAEEWRAVATRPSVCHPPLIILPVALRHSGFVRFDRHVAATTSMKNLIGIVN